MTTERQEPREYTLEETREKLLRHVWAMVDYWEKAQSGAPTERDRMEGLAFSILSCFDGGFLDLPAFSVIPNPHPEDEGYHKTKGQNWFPDGGDIGPLHETFHAYAPGAAQKLR